jgi:signal transduction histidine kinase
MGGVCAGLAEHLRADVLLVRAVFVVLTGAGGLGAVLYAVFWAVVPVSAAPLPADGPPVRRLPVMQVVMLAGVGLGALLLAEFTGIGLGFLWPASLAAIGGALLWKRADDAQRARWTAAGRRLPLRLSASFAHSHLGLWQTTLGLLLIVGGGAGFLAVHGALAQTGRALLPIAVVSFGLFVIAGPWMLRTAQQLSAERRARIREQERAEFAARLHDSVLQTLTLIQRNASDAPAVLRLARASERELRGWLSGPSTDGAPATLLGALRVAAAEVEDEHGVRVDVVAVGDVDWAERLEPLVQAAREAMVNAAKSSGASVVSVFLEAGASSVDVFVRDRGCGFDVDAVPSDRYGVRESIIGRMARFGGAASIKSAAGEGTEVRLSMPLAAAGRS